MSSATAASGTLNKGKKRLCYSGMSVFHDEFLMWRCRKAVQCSLIKNLKKNKVNTYLFLIPRLNGTNFLHDFWATFWIYKSEFIIVLQLLVFKMRALPSYIKNDFSAGTALCKNTLIDTGRWHVPLTATYLILILGFLNNSHQLFCSCALILPKYAAVS